MKVLVTGARGKVGEGAVAALQRAGHDVTATDLGPAVFERPEPGEPPYLQADLTEAGEAWAAVDGHDAVVHAAAIPDPLHHAPQRVFGNNVLAAFNVIEACVRSGVDRLVNISSETVPGFVFGEGVLLPETLPITETVAPEARDPYGFGKYVIEQWCDRVAAGASLDILTIRPSWVMHHGNYERNLGPVIRNPYEPSLNFWAYTDRDDLAESIRLAVESDVPGHEVLYVAQPDNSAGLPLEDLVARGFPDATIEVRPTAREDASGIDSSKAQELLGWTPRRSWRDVLTEEGHLREDASAS